jgi:hypothetical protein
LLRLLVSPTIHFAANFMHAAIMRINLITNQISSKSRGLNGSYPLAVDSNEDAVMAAVASSSVTARSRTFRAWIVL